MGKKKIIHIDLKQLEIDELTRRVDGLCAAIEKIVQAINEGKKIKLIGEEDD